MRAHDVAIVTADTAGEWPYFEDQTSDFSYVRLHGSEEVYVSGHADEHLAVWAARLAGWSAGERDASVYFENGVKAHAPYNTICLAEKLARR